MFFQWPDWAPRAADQELGTALLACLPLLIRSLLQYNLRIDIDPYCHHVTILVLLSFFYCAIAGILKLLTEVKTYNRSYIYVSIFDWFKYLPLLFTLCYPHFGHVDSFRSDLSRRALDQDGSVRINKQWGKLCCCARGPFLMSLLMNGKVSTYRNLNNFLIISCTCCSMDFYTLGYGWKIWSLSNFYSVVCDFFIMTTYW